MLKRKLISLLLSTIVSMAIIFGLIFGEWKNPLELVVMIGMYSLLFSPLILGYGLSISVLVEFVTKRVNGIKRQTLTIILLVILASLSVFIFPSEMADFINISRSRFNHYSCCHDRHDFISDRRITQIQT